MELVSKEGKWLEDLHFNIIPKQLNIPRHFILCVSRRQRVGNVDLAAPVEILNLAPAAVVEG